MMIKWILVFLCFAVGYFGTVGILTAFHLLKQYKKVEKLEDEMDKANKNIKVLVEAINALNKRTIDLERKNENK